MNPSRLTVHEGLEGEAITLADLVSNPTIIEDLPAETIPTLIGELEALKARLAGRYYAALAAAGAGHNDGAEDQLLTAKEAAKKLGTTVFYLYRHSKKLPFTVKTSPRQLRFSKRGIEKYIRQRQGG